jgi:hypothetical protein
VSDLLPAQAWHSEYSDEYAVPVDEAPTEAAARVAIRSEYMVSAEEAASFKYEGIRVVNLPYEEGQKGRRRRAHIFSY